MDDSKLLEMIQRFKKQVMKEIDDKSRLYQISPLHYPHGIQDVTMQALESLHYHLELALYRLRLGEMDAMLQRGEINKDQWNSLVTQVKKPYLFLEED